MQMQPHHKAKQISKCLELAVLFEVSADKPGNVSLITGFEGTRYEHFLSSAVVAEPSFELAARRGIAVSLGEIHVRDVEVGCIIKNCVEDIDAWQSGGNTLLGTIILFVPIAVAAGMIPAKNEFVFDITRLRENLKLVAESTTPEDAVAVYEAIRIAKPSGLGKVPEFDVNDLDSEKRIVEEKMSLYQIFKIAEKYDAVCSEWVNNYKLTFDVACPYLKKEIDETKNLSVAIVHTFLKVLAKYPDTFIARKVGVEKARGVSLMAEKILKLGGLGTVKGKELLHEFDSQLRKSGSLFNPGTTADIIAAALALCILSGYRP